MKQVDQFKRIRLVSRLFSFITLVFFTISFYFALIAYTFAPLISKITMSANPTSADKLRMLIINNLYPVTALLFCLSFILAHSTFFLLRMKKWTKLSLIIQSSVYALMFIGFGVYTLSMGMIRSGISSVCFALLFVFACYLASTVDMTQHSQVMDNILLAKNKLSRN